MQAPPGEGGPDRSAVEPATGHRQRVAAVRSIQDGYGLTLVLTVLTIGCLALAGVGTWGGLLGVVLAGGTLLFALRTSRARPRIVRLGEALVAVSIAGATAALLVGQRQVAEGAMGVIGLAIAGIVPFVIIGNIVRSPQITYRLVIGALVVYLLLGLCYAYGFGLIALVSGTPFFVQTATPTTANYLYFSYTTLSTVGYGDFTAAASLGQMIAISEALFGQLYLVSIVAILVANVGRSFRNVTDE
jgi:Ion channel